MPISSGGLIASSGLSFSDWPGACGGRKLAKVHAVVRASGGCLHTAGRFWRHVLPVEFLSKPI